MATRFPLQTLLDHAQHRMAAAERLLLALKRKEEAARLKQEELESYRSEYRTRLTDVTQGGMDIQMLRDYLVFLGKLDLAIRHQVGEVEQMHGRWLTAHENWVALRQKVKSFEVLEARHLEAEMRKQEQRDQKQMDEFSSRKTAVARLTDSHRG